MLGLSERFQENLDHTSSRTLFSQCELSSTNNTKTVLRLEIQTLYN